MKHNASHGFFMDAFFQLRRFAERFFFFFFLNHKWVLYLLKVLYTSVEMII